MTVMVFHGFSWCSNGVQAGRIVYDCLHGGILRTWSIGPAAMLYASEPLQINPTNRFKAVQHPVQGVILKDLGGMKVYFFELVKGLPTFPTEPLLVPGAEMIRWPMIESILIRKHELRVLWLHALFCEVDGYSTMVWFGSNSIQHN